jgi:hypothetical protein
MNKASFVIMAVLLLGPLPAFGQGGPDGDRRDSYSRRDRDWEDMFRGMEGGHEGMRRGRGAAFFLRSGDATVGVRCDPQESMKACVDATLTLLDRARSMVPPGTAPGGQSSSK